MFSESDLQLFEQVASSNKSYISRLLSSHPREHLADIRRWGSTESKVASEVSCLIPFAGEHEFLFPCLRSLFAQSLQPAEVVVGYDRKGELPELPAEFAGKVKIIRASAPGAGPFRLMEDLLRMTSKRLIMLQDSDDLTLPRRLEMQLRELDEGGYDVVGTGIVEFRDDRLEHFGILPREPYLALQKAFGQVVLYPTLLFRREAYFACGGFRHHERFGLDTEFANRLVAFAKARNISEPLYLRRCWVGSLTLSAQTGFGSSRRKEVSDFTKESWNILYREQQNSAPSIWW